MRSFETNVSILLSSMTVFIDSIHPASISPSKMIHLCNWWLWNPASLFSLDMDRMSLDNTPSVHSRATLITP
jgi:hypothetical protein